MKPQIRVKRLPLALAFFITSALQAQSPKVPAPEAPAANVVWTLNASIRAALDYSPDVRLNRERVNESEARMRGLWSELLPTINATASWTINKDALVGGTPRFEGDAYNAYGLGLELSQPLYRGGLSLAALRAQRSIIDTQKLNLDIAERDTVADVSRAYFQLLVAQSTVEIQKRIRQIQGDLLRTAQSRYRIGREELLSVLQIKTDLALLEPQVVQAENARSLAAANFANLLGIQKERRIEVQGPSATPRLKSLLAAGLEKKAQAENAEIRQAALAVEQNEAIKRAELSVHYPKLEAIASLGRTGFDRSDLFDNDATEYSVGLRLSVPLFSGLSSFHQRSELASRVEQARILERQLRENNGLQRVQTVQQLHNAGVVLDASEEALKQAREAVRVASRTYGLGTSTYLQVSQSQRRLAEAEIAFEQAQYELVNRLLEFSVAHGIPTAELLPLFERSAL